MARTSITAWRGPSLDPRSAYVLQAVRRSTRKDVAKTLAVSPPTVARIYERGIELIKSGYLDPDEKLWTAQDEARLPSLLELAATDSDDFYAALAAIVPGRGRLPWRSESRAFDIRMLVIDRKAAKEPAVDVPTPRELKEVAEEDQRRRVVMKLRAALARCTMADCNLGELLDESDRLLTPKKRPYEVTGEALSEPVHWRGRQWAVTSYGVEALDGTYAIIAERLWDTEGDWDWLGHMSKKAWVDTVDFVEALARGRSHHFPMRADVRKTGVILSVSRPTTTDTDLQRPDQSLGEPGKSL